MIVSLSIILNYFNYSTLLNYLTSERVGGKKFETPNSEPPSKRTSPPNDMAYCPFHCEQNFVLNVAIFSFNYFSPLQCDHLHCSAFGQDPFNIEPSFFLQIHCLVRKEHSYEGSVNLCAFKTCQERFSPKIG